MFLTHNLPMLISKATLRMDRDDKGVVARSLATRLGRTDARGIRRREELTVGVIDYPRQGGVCLGAMFEALS